MGWPAAASPVTFAPRAVAPLRRVPVAGDGSPVAAGAPGPRPGREHRQQAVRVDRPSLGLGPRDPVALAADPGHVGVGVHGADGHEVDHRLLAGRRGELELRAATERIVGARVDADAAQDAARLVDVVLLEDPGLGHQGAGRARLRAAPARHARGVVEAHVERGRDERVEAEAHEVVARRANDLHAHLGAPPAVDAARRLTQDEGVGIVADVVVVEAGEAVLRGAPEARPGIVLRFERLERRPVLDAEAAPVAVADRLAGALEAALRFGHRLCLAVRDLVLEVVLVAHLGRHRLQAVARFLDLVREGHDREERRLRLGEGLAGPDLLEVEPLEVRVHRVGGAPALGHGLDDGRRPDARVAAGEDAGAPGREGDGVGDEAALLRRAHALRAALQPVELGRLADGLEAPVAGDRELGPRGRLGPSAAGRVRLAQAHAHELDAGHAVLPVGEDAHRARLEDGRRALLDRLVDLVARRHVLHVPAVDEGHLLHPLPDRGARAVHGREAPADDDDTLAGVIGVGQAARGRVQVLESVEDLLGVLAGDVQVVGLVAADGHAHGVEALVLEVVEAEVAPEGHVRAELPAQVPDALVLRIEDALLGQAVLGDAVAVHPALLLVALVAVAVADGDGLLDLVAPAVLLAWRRADPTEDAGEGDGPLEDARRLAELAFRVGLEEAGDVDVAGALVLAGREAVRVVVAEDELEVRPAQAAHLLRLGRDDHPGFGQARAADRGVLLALDVHDAHAARPEAGQLGLVAQGGDFDPVVAADLQDRLPDAPGQLTPVDGDREGGRGERPLWGLGGEEQLGPLLRGGEVGAGGEHVGHGLTRAFFSAAVALGATVTGWQTPAGQRPSPISASDSAAKQPRPLSNGSGARRSWLHSPDAMTSLERSTRSSRSCGRWCPAAKRSAISTRRLRPMRQGMVLPHASSDANRSSRRPRSTAQADSSATTIEPEPRGAPPSPGL